jgi:hypothetical protein
MGGGIALVIAIIFLGAVDRALVRSGEDQLGGS